MSASRTVKRHMNLMSVVVFLACLLLVGGNAVFAEPYLQLDAHPAAYVDGEEQSIVTDVLQFTLYALVNSIAPEAEGVDLMTENFYISIAIIPDPGYDESGHDLGSYEFGGETFNVTAGDTTEPPTYDAMVYGTPPLDEYLNSQDDYPPHGVFDTYYREHEFQLTPTGQQILYDSQDFPGGPDQFTPNPGDDLDLYYQAFSVDASGLLYPPYRLHFDFYTKDGEGGIAKFAPLSHDVLATPIPASVILGMLGLGVVGLKLRKFA